jgi:hypothetical protein
MTSFYAACDALVLPSRSEGCPNVVLEAMAMRKTVVASDAAVVEDVLRHGREGLVYPVGDIDALTSDLAMLTDDRIREGLAERAFLRATEELTADACARRLANVLHGEVERAAARARNALLPMPVPIPAGARLLPQYALAVEAGRGSVGNDNASGGLFRGADRTEIEAVAASSRRSRPMAT